MIIYLLKEAKKSKVWTMSLSAASIWIFELFGTMKIAKLYFFSMLDIMIFYTKFRISQQNSPRS